MRLYILLYKLGQKGKRLFSILLLLCIAFTAKAQLAPAGVNPANAPLRLWLRADVLVNGGTSPADGGNVTSWTDLSQKSKAIYKSTSSNTQWQTAPKYKANSWDMNFYPAINFDRVAGSSGYQQYLSTTTGIMTAKSPEEFTVFVVANVDFARVADTGSGNNPQQVACFMGFGKDNISGNNNDGHSGSDSERAPSLGVTGGRRGNVATNGGGKGRFCSNDGLHADDFDGKAELFASGSTTIAVYEVAKKDYIQYEADARKEVMSVSSGLLNKTQAGRIMSQSGITMNGASMVGTGGRPARNMIGDIAEIIVYEGVLPLSEKRKVYTYLALKYGITLDESNSIANVVGFDYGFSAAVPIWYGKSYALHHTYHRDVASIFTDNASSVVNTKSRSTADDNFITIGLRNPSEQLPDQAAIVWGHNGKPVTTKNVPANRCAPFQKEFDRVWLLDRSLTSHTDKAKRELVLKASTPYSDTYPFEGKGWDTYLLIAKNETNANNKNWDLMIPATIQYDAANGIWEQVFNFELGQDVEKLFFSFGGTENESACSSCTFTGEDKLLMAKKTGNWKVSIPANQTTPVILKNMKSARQLISMDVEFKSDNGVSLGIDVPAVHDQKHPVHLRASGSANAKSSIKYTFNQPTNVEFTIGDIDNSEYVNVYGYCEVGGSMTRPKEVIQPILKGSDQRRGYTYRISNTSEFSGTGAQSAGRGNPRGMVSVSFGKAVKVVVIEYSSTKSGARWLDLFPLSFSCPPQMPPPNEAGYAFQKRGPRALDICETADYTFTVMNANVDCGREPVHFTDYLPEGMYWVPGSLVIDGEAVDAGKPFVMQDRMLDLALLIRGSGNKTTFKAQAAFTDNAASNRNYYNGSLTTNPANDESFTKITYTRKDNGQPGTLHSTDAYYTSGTDRRTKTAVTGTKTYKNITTSMEFKPMECFRQNQKIEVKVKIHNPNKLIQSDANNQLYFETYFNENCTYVAGSLTINGNPLSDTATGVTIGTGDDNGLITLEGVSGFSLPANGDVEISYVIQVPEKDKLTYITVGNKKEYDDLGIGHVLNMITDDICLQNAFLNALGEYAIRYCNSKGTIISNRMIPSRLK
jgi:uncharacterized repeat protein (TIGR01451 family)